ncbi:MAG: hypothetical protein ABIN68_01300 [Sphingomicrobium sp.]
MQWKTEDRAEWAVDIAAAVIFAVAVAYCLRAMGSAVEATTVAAALAFLVAHFGLRRVLPREPAYALPAFSAPTFEAWAELPDELLLKDELGGVGPDARVVRLFGSSQNHLPSRLPPPDASEALIEALAALRRTFHQTG